MWTTRHSANRAHSGVYGDAPTFSCCRQIQVAVESRDPSAASIKLAVLLAGSSTPGKPRTYRGQQPVIDEERGRTPVESRLENGTVAKSSNLPSLPAEQFGSLTRFSLFSSPTVGRHLSEPELPFSSLSNCHGVEIKKRSMELLARVSSTSFKVSTPARPFPASDKPGIRGLSRSCAVPP